MLYTNEKYLLQQIQKYCSHYSSICKKYPIKNIFEEFTSRNMMKLDDYTMNRLYPSLFGVYSPILIKIRLLCVHD